MKKEAKDFTIANTSKRATCTQFTRYYGKAITWDDYRKFCNKMDTSIITFTPGKDVIECSLENITAFWYKYGELIVLEFGTEKKYLEWMQQYVSAAAMYMVCSR